MRSGFNSRHTEPLREHIGAYISEKLSGENMGSWFSNSKGEEQGNSNTHNSPAGPMIQFNPNFSNMGAEVADYSHQFAKNYAGATIIHNYGEGYVPANSTGGFPGEESSAEGSGIDDGEVDETARTPRSIPGDLEPLFSVKFNPTIIGGGESSEAAVPSAATHFQAMLLGLILGVLLMLVGGIVVWFLRRRGSR